MQTVTFTQLYTHLSNFSSFFPFFLFPHFTQCHSSFSFLLCPSLTMPSEFSFFSFFDPFSFKQHCLLPFQIPLFPVLITSLSLCMLAISLYISLSVLLCVIFSLFLCLSVLSAMWLKGHVCVVCRLNKQCAASWWSLMRYGALLRSEEHTHTHTCEMHTCTLTPHTYIDLSSLILFFIYLACSLSLSHTHAHTQPDSPSTRPSWPHSSSYWSRQRHP